MIDLRHRLVDNLSVQSHLYVPNLNHLGCSTSLFWSNVTCSAAKSVRGWTWSSHHGLRTALGAFILGNLPSDGRRDPVGISKHQIVLLGAGKCLCSGATYWSCFRLSKFHLEMTYCTSPPIFAAENAADMSKRGNDPSQRGPMCKQFSFDQKCPNFQDKFSANSRNNCGAVFISSYQFCLNSFLSVFTFPFFQILPDNSMATPRQHPLQRQVAVVAWVGPPTRMGVVKNPTLVNFVNQGIDHWKGWTWMLNGSKWLVSLSLPSKNLERDAFQDAEVLICRFVNWCVLIVLIALASPPFNVRPRKKKHSVALPLPGIWGPRGHGFGRQGSKSDLVGKKHDAKSGLLPAQLQG